MSDEAFMIVFDRPSAGCLTLAHAIIKEHTSQWWHQFDHVWMVQGHTAEEWRYWLTPAAKVGPRASVMVLKLPSANASRSWSAWVRGTEKVQWLHGNYTAPKD